MKERKKTTSSRQLSALPAGRQVSAISRQRRASATGLTVMELLVAVVIMVIMILAFGIILTQTQKVVSGSQAIMRSNNTAAAIAHVIRNDLRQITKNGFLCITRYNGANRPYLLFTTAGPSHSRFGNYLTLTGLSTYGWVEPRETGGVDLHGNNILFHQGWLTWDSGAGNEYDVLLGTTDVLNFDLTSIQKKTRPEINIFVNQLYDNNRIPRDYPAPPSQYIAYPPETIAEITDAWQILSAEIISLGIMWTDGTKDPVSNELYWYGVDSNYNAGSKDSISGAPSDEWTGLTIANDVAEFDAELSAGNGDYRALWTRHDQNNWPTAVKIKFRIRDPILAAAAEKEGTTISEGIWYEVICPIGQ